MKQYYMPVKIIMGKHCVTGQRELFGQMGKKALIVTGRHSAAACGALADVQKALEENGQEYALYDRVMNNPTVECVYEGAAMAREQKADFIAAIGGGSPMDAAKAIAMLAKNDISPKKIFSGVASYDALPMIHIPTTAGTGSEVTPYAILTNPEKETKTSIFAPSLFPRYALLDARYLAHLPERSMNHTVIDSLSHSVEGMFSVRASQITDGMALQAIGMIARCLPALKKNQLTAEEHCRLLEASTLGGMVISATGTTIVHSMGYSLTYFHGADHGRANGLLLPAFLKVASRTHYSRVEKILSAMKLSSVEQFEKELDALLGKRGTLTVSQIEKYTDLASGSKNIKNCVVPVTPAEIREIFTNSFKSSH